MPVERQQPIVCHQICELHICGPAILASADASSLRHTVNGPRHACHCDGSNSYRQNAIQVTRYRALTCRPGLISKLLASIRNADG